MKQQPPKQERLKDFSEVKMVITAPEPYAASLAQRAGARMTLGTLTQLISNTEKHVVLSVPYIQERDAVGTPIYIALQSALERGVDVDIASTLAGLQVIKKRDIGKNAKGRLRFFCPQANIDNERRVGSHAKFCVCDDSHAYVGSANLTMPGLAENIELGILVHGRVAQQIMEFWDFLLDQGFLVQTEQL